MFAGGSAPCVLNAANEVAVAAFLRWQIGFTDIAKVVEACLDKHVSGSLNSIDELLELDSQVRGQAEEVAKAV